MDWPFTYGDLLQAAYDALTRAGNLTADSDGGWVPRLDQAHHKLGLVLAHTAAAQARFELDYAARSGVPAEDLRAHGRYAEPCGCWARGLRLSVPRAGSGWPPGSTSTARTPQLT